MKAMWRRSFSFAAVSFFAALFFIVLLTACHVSSAMDGKASASLSGAKWLLIEIAGRKIAVDSERPAYLFFDEKNRLSGSGGCNRLAGEYRLTSDRLHISRLIATKMLCLDMRVEDALLAALPNTTAYALLDGGAVLTLYDDKAAPIAVFRRENG
jgi:heat shock protein HslJ